MATKRPCESCGRQVNPDRPGADHLFNRPDGSEVWLCGRPACLRKYNEEEENNIYRMIISMQHFTHIDIICKGY